MGIKQRVWRMGSGEKVQKSSRVMKSSVRIISLDSGSTRKRNSSEETAGVFRKENGSTLFRVELNLPSLALHGKQMIGHTSSKEREKRDVSAKSNDTRTC